MKKSVLVFSLLLMAIIQSCSLQDHVVPEPSILPISIRAIIDQRYPGHSELDPSALEQGKIFLVKFSQQGKTYSLISNNTDILEAQYAAGTPGDSLKALINGTTMQGGTFSNHRLATEIFQSNPAYPAFNLVDYTLNGVTYTVKVKGSSLELMDHLDHFYRTQRAEDLPDKIQQFLNDRNKPNPAAIAALPLLNTTGKNLLSQNNELKFQSATGWILHGGKKYYELSAKYYGMTTLSLLFNENGDLVWSPSFTFLERWPNLDAPSSFATNLLPAEIDELKSKFTPWDAIKDFSPEASFANWHDKYAGVDSYSGSFVNTLPGGKSEKWMLRYDANKNLIWRSFYY
ncbi:hypothetical protein [Dyadobacter sp. OTU695]|uniref:hypothetical protein n=1 Tax=Dyadobacter sp. OTU695 TaxID=3043860 RepID=UPI00313C5D73